MFYGKENKCDSPVSITYKERIQNFYLMKDKTEKKGKLSEYVTVIWKHPFKCFRGINLKL